MKYDRVTQYSSLSDKVQIIMQTPHPLHANNPVSKEVQKLHTLEYSIMQRWLEWKRPVMWVHTKCLIDNARAETASGGCKITFDTYYDMGYGYTMVIVNQEEENAIVFQAAKMECFEFEDYVLVFAGNNPKNVQLYKRVGAWE